MEASKSNILTFLGFTALIAATLIGFRTLSGEIAVHFNADGQPDNFMPMIPGLLFLPVLTVLIYVMLEYLPELDPLGSNYENFEDVYNLLKASIVGIMAYVQIVIVGWNLGFQYKPTVIVVPVIFTALYLSGKVMEKAEKNWFVGIRNPWTLSNDKVWKKTHEKTAPLMKGSGIISLTALIAPEYALYIFLIPVMATVVYSTVYSYWLYQQEEK